MHKSYKDNKKVAEKIFILSKNSILKFIESPLQQMHISMIEVG